MNLRIFSRPLKNSMSPGTIDVCWFENGRIIGELPREYKNALFGKATTVFYIKESEISLFIKSLVDEYEIDYLIGVYKEGKQYAAFYIKQLLEGIKKQIEEVRNAKNIQPVEVVDNNTEVVSENIEVIEKKETKKSNKKQTKQLEETLSNKSNEQQDEEDSGF